jgi:hypothetical protein
MVRLVIDTLQRLRTLNPCRQQIDTLLMLLRDKSSEDSCFSHLPCHVSILSPSEW